MGNQEGDNLELNINHDNISDDNRRRNSSPSLVKESKINHLPELVRDSNQCESQVESTSQTVRDNNEDIEVRDVIEEENITENDELSTTDIQDIRENLLSASEEAQHLLTELNNDRSSEDQ